MNQRLTYGVRHLTVRYGAVTALDSVTVAVDAGETLGVIGGDGAGKSTLLRAMVGERLNSSGSVDRPVAERIGFVPSAGGFYHDLTIGENIEFVASAFGLRDWRDRARTLLDHAELTSFTDRLAGNLSGGQQRKLAASMALLPSPELLVLDEVTTGVDPVSRMALWRILGAAAATGTAVVVATTYLDEAERTDTVLLLEAGRVLASGPPDQIAKSMPGAVFELDHPTDATTAWRRGRRWRQWAPTSNSLVDHTPIVPALEDAAIVLELVDRGIAQLSSSDGGR